MTKDKFQEEVENLYKIFDDEVMKSDFYDLLSRGGLIESFEMQFINMFQDQLERLQDLVGDYLSSDNLENLEEQENEQIF